jgi:hypothetical protein
MVLTNMQSAAKSGLPYSLRKALLIGVLLALALIITGRVFAPAMSLISTAAGLTILLIYGVLAAFCPMRLHHRHPDILRLGTLFGSAAGAVFAGEIIAEYILLPRNNSVYGLVEFGAVLMLYFGSGFVSGLRSLSLKNAMLSSVVTAFIASLIWVICLLAVFYAFHGSARQTLVLRAEGDYDDFTRSGMSDFNTFIMEDIMGATFFHLLLGPLVGAVLGILGCLLGKVVTSRRK